MTRSAVFPEASPAPLPVKESDWSPRMWHGCDFFAWIKLLGRNRFRVHWSCLYIALVATIISFGNTLIRWLQEGRIKASTEVPLAGGNILRRWTDVRSVRYHLGTKITNLFGDTSPTSLARASRNRCSRSAARMSPRRRAGL